MDNKIMECNSDYKMDNGKIEEPHFKTNQQQRKNLYIIIKLTKISVLK